MVIVIYLAGLFWPALVTGAGRVQPACLEPIGVRELVENNPYITGRNVHVGIVELSQPHAEDASAYAFMPNFEHGALLGAKRWGLYHYENPHRPVGVSDHASMITGILVGNDPNANHPSLGSFRYRGIVPEATVDVFETNWFIYKRVLAGGSEPIDCDVITMSWGTDAGDAITMWWQRGIDALVERESVVAVAASGNGSNEFATISKPSWGYNVISVGAARSLGSFPDFLRYVGPPILEYSSFGPTDDGRCKPDIIAPGACLGPSGYSIEGYYCVKKSAGYSSYAAPQVAGAGALLVEAARQNKMEEATDPRLIKALLLNGANKLVGWHKGASDTDDDHIVPLDYRQGAGMVDVWKSYQQLRAGRYDPNSYPINIGWDLDEVSLDPNDPNSLRIYSMPETLDAGDNFTTTLCWYKHYDQEGIFNALPLNTLKPELWSVDDKGQLEKRLDYSASQIDNLQHIYYHSPDRQKVALVVRSAGGEETQTLESYALVYCQGQSNWQGDQLTGDLDADGIVGVNDMAQLLKAWWAQKGNYNDVNQYLPEDLNVDGRIDGGDFDVMSRQWQRRSEWYEQK